MYEMPFAYYIGTQEIWIIAVLVLVLFGGSKIPVFARGFGEAMREFKKSLSGEEETKSATGAEAAAAKKDEDGKQVAK
jgi:sec-independent protein translocase protein TatA